MDNYEPKAPFPWLSLTIVFVLCTILLVSLCLAILDPSQMEMIQGLCGSPSRLEISLFPAFLIPA